MKKLLFLTLMIGVMAGMVFSQTITVTSPASGVNWEKGSSKTILWTKSGSMDANVKITIYTPDGSTLVKVITMSTPNDGTYPWTVASDVPVGSYIIRVKTTDNAVYDNSDTFNITAASAASITVTSPAAGVDWEKGSSKTIQWTKSGSMDANVKITLYTPGGGTLVKVITMSTPNDGSYPWTVPSDVATGDYIIRVKTTDNEVYDDSNTFQITSGSGSGDPGLFNTKLVVTSPKLNDSWRIGSTKPITWNRVFLWKPVFKVKYTPLKKVEVEKKLNVEKVAKLKQFMMLLKTVKIQIRRINCTKYPITKKYLFWTTIKSHAIDGKWGGTYNWPIPSNMKSGCYQIKVTENRTDGRSATSKKFTLYKMIIKPGVLKKVKTAKTVKVLKEKG